MEGKRVKVKELTTLTGFQGRATGGKEYKLIKMKDIDCEGNIDYYNLESFNSDRVDDKYILKMGDILIKTKSGENTAAIIEEDFENMVATSHFTIIRIGDKEVLDPYYLLTYINSFKAQEYFKRNARGTVQPMISKGIIDELDIKMIDIESQVNIGIMHKRRQAYILETEKKKSYMKQAIHKMIMES